jgi:hypothetical protein
METAKVEIRKLQLLNDRINQCIDALNQVRLSVHGLSHTPGISASAGIPQFTQSPYAATGLGTPYAPGFVQQSGGIPSPFGPQQAVPPQFGLGQAFNPVLGLSHTSLEGHDPRPVWTDPVMAARIAQTFPYLYLSVSPAVGTIY